MILVVCTSCALCVRVIGNLQGVAEYLVGPESDFWPDKFPCPTCTRPARGVLELEADPAIAAVLRYVDLTAEEAYAAFNGFGLPDEQVCTLETVTTLLKEHPVRRVVGEDIAGTTRCVLSHLELWDGTKLYLGAGGDGACVYRVAPPSSYAAKVADDPA